MTYFKSPIHGGHFQSVHAAQAALAFTGMVLMTNSKMPTHTIATGGALTFLLIGSIAAEMYIFTRVRFNRRSTIPDDKTGGWDNYKTASLLAVLSGVAWMLWYIPRSSQIIAHEMIKISADAVSILYGVAFVVAFFWRLFI